MDWIAKIAMGMKLIKQGCAENTEWAGCQKCPFDELCDALNKGGDYYDSYMPDKWEV